MTPFEATLAAVLALPASVEDKADPRQSAHLQAIALEVSQLKPPRGIGAKDWRAIVLASGFAETHMSLRIMDGLCKAFECDRGKARSGWQLHSNDFTRPVWDQLQGLDNLHVQVVTADSMLKRSYYQCGGASRAARFSVLASSRSSPSPAAAAPLAPSSRGRASSCAPTTGRLLVARWAERWPTSTRRPPCSF